MEYTRTTLKYSYKKINEQKQTTIFVQMLQKQLETNKYLDINDNKR